MRDPAIAARLREVHGTGLCRVCGLPCVGEGDDYCTYPHAMLPREIRSPEGWGFWVWETIEPEPLPPHQSWWGVIWRFWHDWAWELSGITGWRQMR